jgi:2-methylisocitrate lyase-like PEP mutase family enzyme
MTQAELAQRFLALHAGDGPLLMPNPWDVGSAKLLAQLGFEALATTSSGIAATLGRVDGSVTRDEALSHAAAIAGATALPVSADLENGFADAPADVAQTVALAVEAGVAGCSIEDFTGDEAGPIYCLEHAVARIAAAVAAAHAGPVALVLTARAENHIHGVDDLDDTIVRLRAYAAAGADVVYAPGLTALDDIRRVVEAVAPTPLNVLTLPGTPDVAQLAAAGVRRISVGGTFAFAAVAAVQDAARELLEEGTYGYLQRAKAGSALAKRAFR